MISHAKISRHHRMFKTPTDLSTEGFKQILPFHHRRSGAPIQRPKNPERQRQFYTGKKKRHSIKNNLIIDSAPGRSRG